MRWNWRWLGHIIRGVLTLCQIRSKEKTQMNNWEKTCKEFLKGCLCVNIDKQEECKDCTQGFCNQLRDLAIKDGYTKVNENCKY